VAAGEDQTGAGWAEQGREHRVQAVVGAGHRRYGAQLRGQPVRRADLGRLTPQRVAQQPGPGRVRRWADVGHGSGVRRKPAEQVFVQQRGAGLPEQCPPWPIGFAGRRVDQRRVQAQQRGEAVGVGGHRDAQRPPEPGDPVGRLAAEHAIRS
jgi:hypothetical protein